MEKVVIFHLSYKGKVNMGNRTERKDYSTSTKKSVIVNDFCEWIKEENVNVDKECGEQCVIDNLKIIGL